MLIDMVGGSIGVLGKGFSTERSQIVSETVALVSPAIITISPATTSSTGIFLVPSNLKSLVSLPMSTFLPAKLIAFTFSFIRALPCPTRPTKHLPKKLSAYKRVTNIAKGLFASTFGAGTCSNIKSNKACKFSFGCSNSFTAQPSRPDA